MSANNTFPGVYVSIVDNSQYAESIPGAIGFMCIFSQKGEDNKPVLTTSASDLIKRYGEGNAAKYGQGWYVAKQYVDVLSNLWVMRVLPTEATYASLALKVTTKYTDKVDGEGNKYYTHNYHKLNGKGEPLYKDSQGQKTTEATDASTGASNTPITYTMENQVSTLNADYDKGPVDIVDGVAKSEGTPDTVKVFAPIEYTEGVQTGGSTVAAVNLTGLTKSSKLDASISTDTADIIFYPKGRGLYYNNYGIKITPASGSYDNAYVLDFYIQDEDTEQVDLAESFIVSFDKDARDMSGESIFITDVLDMYSSYLKCKVDTDLIGNSDLAQDTKCDFSAPFSEIVMFNGGTDGQMYDSNGYIDWESVKDDMVQAYQGLLIDPSTGEDSSFVTDPEEMDFSVVFDAGYPKVVKDSIQTLCDSRDCCFGFLDNGDSASASAALDKRSGKTTSFVTNYNDYRLALYEPYTKVYDSFSGQNIWMTPIYHVASAFCKTARDKNIWWAFAGLQRGSCSGIQEFRYKLAGGYKEQFKTNEINPIMRFTQGGDVIWGNWTTQQTPSALRNIHVVLCLHYIYRTLKKNLKQYIFEFNDAITWAKIKDNIVQFLSQIQSERALEYFSVKVSANDYQKRNNQCQVDVNLRVTGTIETINVSLIAE